MSRVLGGWLGVVAALLLAFHVQAHEGCHLTSEAVEGTSGFFLIVGSDFAPNEDVDLQLFMNHQPVFPEAFTRTADADGTVSDGLTFTDEDPQGEYELTATADSCTAETTLHWSGLPDTATEGPAAEAGLPVGLAVAVLAGLLAFGYFFVRPWRATDRRD